MFNQVLSLLYVPLRHFFLASQVDFELVSWVHSELPLYQQEDPLDPISKHMLGIWLNHCACAKREVGQAERADLKEREGIVRSKIIEIDAVFYCVVCLENGVF